MTTSHLAETQADTQATSPRVLMLTGSQFSAQQLATLQTVFAQVIQLPCPASLDEILSQAGAVTDYILGGPEYIDAAAFARMPQLRRLVLLGTGIPSFVDLAAVTPQVKVMNTPHLNAASVAEFALAMLIANAAGALASADEVRSGSRWRQTPWKTLSEHDIGIVGLGHVGSALLEKLSALGARKLRYCSRERKPHLEAKYGAIFLPLEQLLAQCSLVSVHVGYSATTHHMFNQHSLAACRTDLQLHCFANPRTIDPHAARAALLNGQLQQIYMDGYYREWTDNQGMQADAENLLALPRDQFWATSHLAAQTEAAIAQQLALALEKLLG